MNHKVLVGLVVYSVLVGASTVTYAQQSLVPRKQEIETIDDSKKPVLTAEQKETLMDQVRELGIRLNRSYYTGKYDEAKVILSEVVTLEEQVYGPVHHQLLGTFAWQARIGVAAEDYPSVIKARQRAFEIGSQLFAEGAYQLRDLQIAVDEARRLPNLSQVQRRSLATAQELESQLARYYQLGNFNEAISLLRQILSIRKEVLGEKNVEYANGLSALALIHCAMSDFVQAEPLLIEAKRVRGQLLGSRHPDYADVLVLLAKLSFCLGDCKNAEPLYLEALSALEQAKGKVDTTYADCLLNLANLYEYEKDFAKAELLYLEAREISVRNESIRAHARSLNGLASLSTSMGDYARAESLFLEARSILSSDMNDDRYDWVNRTVLINFIALYDSTGEHQKAEPFLKEAMTSLQEAKANWEKLLGKGCFESLDCSCYLAQVCKMMKKFDLSEALFDDALAITRKHMDATSTIQSELQQMAMDQKLRHRLDSYLDMSFAAPRVPKNAVANALLWKGSVMRRLRGLRQAADDPAIAEQFSKLQSVAGQLSKVAQQTPAPEQAAAWRERLAALTSERESLEKQMVRDSAAFAQAVKPIGLADIQQAIPTDGVLIDYLEFNGKNDRQLLASIVKHDAEPAMVLLGKVSDLQTHVDAWRKAFVEEEHVDAKVGAAAGLAIRQQVWEPLLAHIGDAKTVLVSTDGVLGRLPLGALPGKQPDTYLIEDHRLVLLPVPQLLPLLMEKPADRQMLREMLLIGDVDYRANPQSTKPANDPEPSPRKRPWERSEGIDKVRGTLQWDPLVETGREVEFIGGMYRRLFKPSATALVDLRKAQATETAFREQAPGSTYLHVATHGFFAAADKQSALSGEQIAKRGEDRNMFGENREVLRGYSPGQLSGLVFAGANRMNEEPLTPDPSPRSGARGDRDREDDGILTADEIAYLRLEGTRLLVLSACETGLGEVAGGEGLIGIQRGFQLAGARSTVSSLWKVNDAATRRLMEEFYTNFLEREMSMLDALREAQLWALRNPNDVPRGATIDLPNAKMVAPEQKRLSPRYWAAFVLSGDWR